MGYLCVFKLLFYAKCSRCSGCSGCSGFSCPVPETPKCLKMRHESLGLRSVWHSAQVGEHGGAGFDAHKEARDLHILIGGVVGLVGVGVGNAKGRDAQRFVEDVLGQAGSLATTAGRPTPLATATAPPRRSVTRH